MDTMDMLTIPFPITEIYTEMPELWYGNKPRFSTMTSVVFINQNLMVCSSYYSKCIYLVNFDIDKKIYTILDSIPTNGPTDLIDYRQFPNQKDGSIQHQLIVSNFTDCSTSIYEIINDCTKLSHINRLINKELGFHHGISFYQWDPNIIFIGTSGTTNPNCGVYAIRITDGYPIFAIKEPGWLCKDVCFMDNNNMFVIYCNNAPSPIKQRQYSTKIVWYSLISIQENTYKKISETMLYRHHADSCKYHNKKIYITVEGVDTPGRVIIYSIMDDDTLGKKYIKEYGSIKGYQFPHGLDINYGLIAVSEYKCSDIIIKRFCDDIIEKTTQMI